MTKRFAIVRTMKRYPRNQFHSSFTRFNHIIVTQREYERIYGYDAYRIIFESDNYDECLKYKL